jgi:phosphoglycolate phosphatase
MTTKSFEIVGFDLDGTLVDSSGDLTAAVNDTLAAAGRAPLTVTQVKTMVGGGAKHMLKQGLEATGGIDEDAFRPLYKRMRWRSAACAWPSAPTSSNPSRPDCLPIWD